MVTRNNTKVIRIGDKKIGGGNPVLIQSMTNTKTEDVESTVTQILSLEKAGCDIVRCTVPTPEAADALGEIKKRIHIPLVADIHFNYKLAIAAMENGADKIRINPGNIGGEDSIRAVIEKAKEYGVPIRVGVNSGSLEKELVEKYHGVTAEGLVESAVDKVRMIEAFDYDNLAVSIKSSDVLMCARAYAVSYTHLDVYKRQDADHKTVGSIDRGFLVLIGVGQNDTRETADKLIKKMAGLRIFDDENGKTNLALKDVDGSLLLVSQFTLYACLLYTSTASS